MCAVCLWGESGRGWEGKGRRKRKTFKDRVTPEGAIFSFLELSAASQRGDWTDRAPGRKVGHHPGAAGAQEENRAERLC